MSASLARWWLITPVLARHRLLSNMVHDGVEETEGTVGDINLWSLSLSNLLLLLSLLSTVRAQEAGGNVWWSKTVFRASRYEFKISVKWELETSNLQDCCKD